MLDDCQRDHSYADSCSVRVISSMHLISLESPQRHMSERHANGHAGAAGVISQSISRLVIYASDPQRFGTRGNPETPALARSKTGSRGDDPAYLYVVILSLYFSYESASSLDARMGREA